MKRQTGFTLLEVLLALAVVGIAVTVILQLFSSNLRNIAGSEEYVKAALRAEARLHEIVEGADPSERRWSETTRDGYRIDVAITPVLKDRAQTVAMTLLQVDLSLSWRSGMRNRTISLSTLKLVGPGDVTKGTAS